MNTDTPVVRILAVDDHPLLREGIAALIANEPDMKLVAEASNGREAIEQFRRVRPDVTLMDVQMPDMSGIDALIAIREEAPKAKIIVLTTYGGGALAKRGNQAGGPADRPQGPGRQKLFGNNPPGNRGQKPHQPDVASLPPQPNG